MLERAEQLGHIFHYKHLGSGALDNIEKRTPKLLSGISIAVFV